MLWFSAKSSSCTVSCLCETVFNPWCSLTLYFNIYFNRMKDFSHWAIRYQRNREQQLTPQLVGVDGCNDFLVNSSDEDNDSHDPSLFSPFT